MNTQSNPTRILEIRSGENLERLIILHPAMPGRLNIRSRLPGQLCPNDALTFEKAWHATDGQIWNDLHAALKEHGLSDRHAELLCDAWDMRAAGFDVCFPVPPLAS